jgi:hypothetical protein
MPNRGTATYTGMGGVGLVRGGTTLDSSTNTATVTADFAAARVDVDMPGFTGDAATAGNFDRIQINGMAISGNRFTGGTLVATRSGNPVTPIGTVTSQSAQGAFFGSDLTNGTPDEVGGLYIANGSTGTLTGAFVAD